MFTVFLIDDDPVEAHATSKVLRANRYDVQIFTSSRSFLAHHDSAVPGCVVVNIDGLELQQTLIKLNSPLPVIFVARNADIPGCVRAIKSGAIDFMTKPAGKRELLAAIKVARRRNAEARRADSDRKSINARLATLSPRQNEVLRHVVAGKINRQIADVMGTVEKTIKVHRGQVMKKLKVRSLVDLVRLAEKVGITQQRPHRPRSASVLTSPPARAASAKGQ